MARSGSFNSEVAARTLAAEKLLNTAELLTQYEAAGGLRSDLEAIVAHGKEAESLNATQGALTKDKSAASLRAQEAFLAVQREYVAIMDVVASLRAELTKAGDTASLAQIKRIMAAEVEVAFAPASPTDGGKKKARRERTQEAMRAEIARDAQLLLDFSAISQRLAARRVDAARLQKLLADAQGLSGKVAERLATAADRKVATTQERAAVANQLLHWDSAKRILSALAKRDVRALEFVRVMKQ